MTKYIAALLSGILITISSVATATNQKAACKIPAQQAKLSNVDNNKALINAFFNAQNHYCPPSMFKGFFNEAYQIIDLGKHDYSSAKVADNIAKRIQAFRHQIPNNHMTINSMVAENNQVFVWFSVYNDHKTKVMEAYVLFTIKNGLISKADEMVAPVLKKTLTH